jgi:hypothetical protein
VQVSARSAACVVCEPRLTRPTLPLLPLASPFLSLNLSGNNRIPAQIMARIQRELRKLRQ